MGVKIYKKNNYCIIDDGSKKEFFAGDEMSIASYDSGEWVIWNTAKQTESFSFNYTMVEDENGTPVGDALAVEEYLTINTNFKTASGSSEVVNMIVVNQSNVNTTLGGVIDSTKEYFIDGIVDLGSTQITIPTTGITLKGYSFDISGLISSEDNYTMFTSESIAIGSGNILGADYYVSVTGVGSKVYEVYDATGFNAFEFSRINYMDCTSLGDIHDYRQGLENGTGRFGGSPSLTLHGLWVGGYRITTSIVRSMSDTTTEPLFKAGTLFQMNSRFLTDINCDLGTLQPFCDFSNTNFPNPSTVQVKEAIISRDGVFNSSDSNVFTNLTNSDLASDFDGNVGIDNTFVGGRAFVSSENLTTIASGSTYYTLNGIWGANNLQHFDSPAGGQLRHLGNNPREFKVTVNFIIESTTDNDIGIFYNFSFNVKLDQNDYVYFQVRNNSGNNNLTLELNSDFLIEER